MPKASLNTISFFNYSVDTKSKGSKKGRKKIKATVGFYSLFL